MTPRRDSVTGAAVVAGCMIISLWLAIIGVVLWAIVNLVPAIVEALTR